MNSSSLDWSIQGALSSLYPPFEATAPTVLSQLFRTIEARYQGDALQCFLDYLIPAKHILESVQQAACAEYSDALFQCEGWPLCLRDRVVVQLAPINPLLLRPGDFYLQVEPFGEQSARIVLKSLLVQDDLLAQEDLLLLAGFRAQEGPAVEETPVPETSYPCIFTEAWLKEINEGRHGNQLHRCVLSSDQGIVKVNWGEVINPELLDRPKTSCTSAGLMRDNSQEEADSPFPANMSFPKRTAEPKTPVLPTQNGVAVSHRLVKRANRSVQIEQRKPSSSPVGKPVGWVSPNTWDSGPGKELEGEYVDLLEFAKEKEALNAKITLIPSIPGAFRPHSPLPKEDVLPYIPASGLMDEHHVPKSLKVPKHQQRASESKGRHRQSYLAAIKNPVSFDQATLPLDELWPGLGETEPGYEAQGVDFGIDSLGSSPVRASAELGQNQNLSTMHLSPELPSLNNAEQPLHLLKDKSPESPPNTVLESPGAFHVNRQQHLTEQEQQHHIWTNLHHKHHKTQHLPKMGLRALPDLRNPRQETGVYKCVGVGRKVDQFVPVPPHKSTGQRPSLFTQPHNNLNMIQCGEMALQAAKGPGRSRPKARSTSLVSESCRERPQEDKLANRSRSDVYPEIIPMVPGVHVQRSKKCTSFVSPKLDGWKAAKNDVCSNGSAEHLTTLQNGTALRTSPDLLQNLSLEHASCRFAALSHDTTIKNVLQLGIICLPGSRDRAGRAVLEIHGGKNGWTSPLLSPLVLRNAILFLHSIPRKQVRDLGLIVLINSRSGPIPAVLYKALLMVQEQVPRAVHTVLLLVEKDQSPRPERPPGLQMEMITSLKSLHKSVDGQQLTSELGGSFPYNHTDCIQFYHKLFSFEMDLHGAVALLQNAIRQLDSKKKIDTAEDVRKRSQEQKSAMRQVLEDTHMVTLQRDGGAILARMRREECRFSQSEDYNDAMEAVMRLYNQVEEGVHTLVRRSNQSLQHLDHVLLLRETEEQLKITGAWCEEETVRWLTAPDPAEETMEKLEQRLALVNDVLDQAKERKEKAIALMKDVERKIQGTCYPETDVFYLHMTKFESDLAAFAARAEHCKSHLRTFIRLFHFCEQAFTLTKECTRYLEDMETGGYVDTSKISQLKSFQERFKAFSPEHFEEEKSNAATKKQLGAARVWSEAYSVCQDVRQMLDEKLQELDTKRTFTQSYKSVPESAGVSTHTPASCARISNIQARTPQCEARGASVHIHEQTTWENMLVKLPREHRSEADLRDVVGRGERNPALGRSHSEGCCVRGSCGPVKASPGVFLTQRECENARRKNGGGGAGFSDMKLEWTEKESRDNPSLDEQDSQISRQESFCSSVSSPGLVWMNEESCSRVYLRERNSDFPSTDPVKPDRLQDASDCNSETESSNHLLKLQHIMEELLQTEREYVKALGFVIEHYFPELERQDVPQDLRGQRGSIFGNLEKLREFHQHHFLNELELSLRQPFRVGRCFLRHKESFGLYSLYSKNKPRSDQLLINHGKEFFKKKQQLLGDKMDLSSYLLKPVQRISKYGLLLQDMLQECDATSHEAPERAELQAALEVIQFQLRHGNNLLAMDDIQECDVNLKEQGQLIRQDEFLVSFRKKKYYRHIFLFQDLILFSKTKKTGVGNDIYIYKQSFKTCDIGMTQNRGDSGLCFEIWFRRRKSQDTYTLQARSYEAKEDWTKDLERILWEQAIHNREIRMQERVFMGIGCKPFMDIKPSEAAICDRAIKCALTGRDCKAPAFSGLSDMERGYHAQRPHSTGSASYVSSCSHSSSSSSSGRGSVSPVGYHISRRVVSVSDPGGFSNPGDFDPANVRQDRLADGSESSGESVSGFSSSGYSFQSVIGGEHDVPEVSEVVPGKPSHHKIEDQHQHNASKLQNQKQDQVIKKSTEV